MSSFKTPLFKVLAFYILLLVILGKLLGFDKKKSSPSNPSAQTTNYQLIKGTVKRPLARGWVIQTNNENSLLTSKNPQDLIHPELIPGSQVVFWAREATPRPTTLPRLWDWNSYLNKESVSRHLILDRDKDLHVTQKASGFFAGIYKYHERLLLKINSRFKNTETSGFLAGLLLGDKRLLQSSLKESFQDAGVMHLLVASGLHVSLWAGLIWLISASLLGLPRRMASGLSLFSLWLFVVFIGANPPVVRAAIMVTALLAGPLLKRETPALVRLFLTALFFLIVNPRLIKDASFLLSFVSTFGILLGWNVVPSKKYPPPLRWLLGIALTSLFAWWSLLPITAYFFHEISLIGPLANMILVPSSSLILGFGIVHFVFLEWVPLLGSWSESLLGWAGYAFIQTTSFLGHLPLATWTTKSWGFCTLLGWALLALALVFRKQMKVLLVFGLISFAFSLLKISFEKQRIYLLSDGQAYQAVFTQKGFQKDLLLATELNRGFTSDIAAFVKTQGLDKIPSPKRTLPRAYPFSRDGEIATKISCGSNVLIFPLSPYPIIAEGEILPSKELICHDHHFL